MQTIDIYCERLGPGLLAEPVNALTNAAFFVAAWLTWREARRHDLAHVDVRALIALTVAIGAGSTLFHTFATPWARMLDQVPILGFQLVFLWSYVRRLMDWPRWAAAAALIAYLAAGLYCRRYTDVLNGSLTYAPALLLTLALAWHHAVRRLAGAVQLARAVGVFVAALVFRTLDETVCVRFPLGTHFLWHLLVAGVAYLAVTALIAALAAALRANVRA